LLREVLGWISIAQDRSSRGGIKTMILTNFGCPLSPQGKLPDKEQIAREKTKAGTARKGKGGKSES